MVLTKAERLARIRVRGVVQGVGFRPFVYRLAHEHHLTGWVRNTSGSVEIEVEGKGEALENFLSDLKAKAPPMARIESVEATFHLPQGLYRVPDWGKPEPGGTIPVSIAGYRHLRRL